MNFPFLKKLPKPKIVVLSDTEIRDREDLIKRVKIKHQIDLDELHYKHQLELDEIRYKHLIDISEIKFKHEVQLKKMKKMQEIELLTKNIKNF